MNKTNVLALAAAIEADTIPHISFSLNFWLEPAANMADHDDYDTTSCGTVACIAGYGHLVSGGTLADWNGSPPVAAWLDLTVSEATHLFTPALDRAYSTVTREQAGKVLRHLAETGEVDWEATHA